MEVSEAQKALTELEERIKALLDEFSRETGLKVYSVSIYDRELVAVGDPVSRYVYEVDVEVRI